MELIPSGHSDFLEIDPELKSIVDKVVDWDKLPKTHFMRLVEEGRKGMNQGWRTSLPSLDNAVYGKHRARYYLIGADSGVGKTTLADFIHLLKSYEYAKARKLPWKCYYYSFELSKTEKIAKWAGYATWLLFGKMLPGDYIMGRIENNLVTNEDLELIRVGYAYVEKMMQHMEIIEDPVNPTKIYADLIDHHYDNPLYGKVLRRKSTDPKKRGQAIGHEPAPGMEHMMVDVFIDHLALLHPEQGLDTKRTMDLMSKYMVALRNLFGTTFTVIQQFSTDMQTWHRSAKKITDQFIAPQRLDFGDSKYTYRDADVVYGLVNPYSFELETYFGYEVEDFKGNLIGVHLMKNRYGKANRLFPLFMNGVVGTFEDMPNTSNLIALETFQNKAAKIEELCLKYKLR